MAMAIHADFDPHLAGLPLLFDPDGIASLFESRWPEPAPVGAVAARHEAPLRTVTFCKIQDVKYQPRTRCVATYLLGVEVPGEGPRQTIGVVEARPAGLRHRLYDQDPDLPWLTSAADPLIVQDRMAAALLPGARIEACHVAPVRYKPGLRCVLRYELLLNTGAQLFFAKLLVEGGRELSATVSALHEASKRTPGMPGVLPVAASWDDLHVLVQPAVLGGTELNELAFDTTVDAPVRLGWMRNAGACLATLHACREVPGPPRTFQDDVQELRDYLAPLEQADPRLAKRFAEAIHMIEKLTTGKDEGPEVASHGAFRTDQFMIEEGRLIMIDLDSFCLANPARDVGNFLAYLDWKELRRPLQSGFIDSTRRAFVEGYAGTGGALDPRWLDAYRAASLLKIGGRRYRSLSFEEWPLVPSLIERATATIK
jgi:hypothetical protein